MKYTQTFLEKSSIKVKKYTCPPRDAVLTCPQTSEWM